MLTVKVDDELGSHQHITMASRGSNTPPLSEKPTDEMIEVADTSSDKERVLVDHPDITPEENKAVLKKIDRNLMPVSLFVDHKEADNEVFCAVVALQFVG